MSPQTIFAFVLLSVFALSSPVHAGITKSNIISHTDLTAALCAGLEYSSPGVNALYDACVDAELLLVTSNTITKRATAQATVTAALCAGLDLKVLGINSRLHDACVAAGLAVSVDVKPKHALTVNTSVNIAANAHLNAMNSCNSLSVQLHLVLEGIAKLISSTVISLSTEVVIPILIKISANLHAAVVATADLAVCTDAAVEASVLQSYNVFSTNLEILLSSISASLTALIYSSAEVKASLHAAVGGLRSTLVVYTNQLDHYLAADLAKSSIKAKLFLTLDAVVKATA